MSWETAKLGEVCTIEKGNIGIMKAIPGEYPLVVLGEERKTHNEFQFDDEAVIIPLVSSTGHGHRSMKRIFFQTGKFSVGSILCAVIPKDRTRLSAGFLYRYLDLNKEKELVSRMKGMANVSLSVRAIADVEIPLPPLAIQQKFIEKFQNLESGRDQISNELNLQLALVKELRQAYLREAMQGKLVGQDDADEPAEILLEKIKAEKEKLVAEKLIKRDKLLPPIKTEEIPFEIPSNWNWCKLGEIIIFGPTNGYSPKANAEEKGVKCLTLTATTSGYFKNEYFKFVDVEVKDDSHLWLNSGDILLQRGNSLDYVGIAALYEGDKKEFIYPDLMIKIRASKVINPNFIHKCLVAPFNRAYFQANAFGAQKSMPKINQGVVINTLIPLPPLAEQERIVAKLEKLMKFCDELEANIKQGIVNADRLLQTALKEALEPK
jgi:type I restriction enzyme, S subunit